MPDYTSSSYVQEPSNSFRLTRADILAKKRREEEREMRSLEGAPPMTPMAREEMADVEMLNRVPKVMMDPRNRAILAQTNQGYQRQFMDEANNANQMNRAEVMRRKQLRDISSRDLAWQTAQADKAFERSQAERLWARDERRYQDERSDKAKALERQQYLDQRANIMALMSSPDELTRIMAQEQLNELNARFKGVADQAPGGQPAQPRSFVNAAQNELVGPSASSGPMMGPDVGPMRPGAAAPSAAPAASMSPLVQAYMKRQQQAEADAESRRKREDLLFNENMANIQEQRDYRKEDRERALQEKERAKQLSVAEDLMRSTDPVKRGQGRELKARLLGVEGTWSDDERIIEDELRQRDFERYQRDPAIRVAVSNLAATIADSISRPGWFADFFSDASLASGSESEITDAVSTLVNQVNARGADITSLAPLIEAEVIGAATKDMGDLSREERVAITKKIKALIQRGMMPVQPSGRGFTRVPEEQQPSRF